MLIALTRQVSRSLVSCELTWLEREQIDLELAVKQHSACEEALTAMGAHVIQLPEQPDLPDAVFVEDPLIVVDEVAILARMGAVSRRPESQTLAEAISQWREIRRFEAPATIEGGDVMRIGRDIFVGLSSRTNLAGVEQLRAVLNPFGYTVRPVDVRGCLHLKSACCSLGDGRILINRHWLDFTVFADYELVDVSDTEPSAANALRIGSSVLMPASFPQTSEIVRKLGSDLMTVNISELMKAEAAITCSSVVFEAFL